MVLFLLILLHLVISCTTFSLYRFHADKTGWYEFSVGPIDVYGNGNGFFFSFLPVVNLVLLFEILIRLRWDYDNEIQLFFIEHKEKKDLRKKREPSLDFEIHAVCNRLENYLPWNSPCKKELKSYRPLHFLHTNKENREVKALLDKYESSIREISSVLKETDTLNFNSRASLAESSYLKFSEFVNEVRSLEQIIHLSDFERTKRAYEKKELEEKKKVNALKDRLNNLNH